jgi:esterase/lipase superfamily enzyme
VDLARRDLEVGRARLIVYGHWGRPLLVFPSELGKRWDWEDTSMIGALAPLVDAGRVKV